MQLHVVKLDVNAFVRGSADAVTGLCSCSFAVVIQQLPNPLRDAICVFYLVLRALDTVEDDMAIENDVKIPALLSFHERIYERYDSDTDQNGEG